MAGRFPAQPLEVRAKFGGGLAAHVAIFFEGFVDDAFEIGGNLRIEAHRRERGAPQDAVKNSRGGVALEWKSARGHFIENNTERKQIAAGIESLAERLLGGHVGDGAHGAARTRQKLRGQCLRAGAGVFRIFRSPVNFGESKIENLGVPARGKENVGRLDVAVKDAFGVRGIQRIGNIDAHVEKTLEL